MPQATFHSRRGTETVEVTDGATLMRAAVAHGIDGIVGECGGQAMCATCHVYVREPYLGRLPRLSEDEDEMLDCAVAPREPDSRLACQIVVIPGLDGIEVDVPDGQV